MHHDVETGVPQDVNEPEAGHGCASVIDHDIGWRQRAMVDPRRGAASMADATGGQELRHDFRQRLGGQSARLRLS